MRRSTNKFTLKIMGKMKQFWSKLLATLIPAQQNRMTQVDIRVHIKPLKNASARKSKYISTDVYLGSLCSRLFLSLYMRSCLHKHSSLQTLRNTSANNVEGSIHFVPNACVYVSQCLYGLLCLQLYLCMYLRCSWKLGFIKNINHIQNCHVEDLHHASSSHTHETKGGMAVKR